MTTDLESNNTLRLAKRSKHNHYLNHFITKEIFMTNANSITALLAVLDQRVLEASHIIKQAHEAAAGGEMNLAVGTLIPAEQYLDDAASLFRVVLSLHRDGKAGAQ